MGWDSPGSPGILAVMFAVGAFAVWAVVGWVSLALQLRRWRQPKPSPTMTRRTAGNGIKVALFIAFVVWALGSSYRYSRSQQPSHAVTVRALAFSPDGEFLYSLDRSGWLKQWNIEHGFETQRWLLPQLGPASGLLVSGDGRVAAVLEGERARVWSLARAAEAAPVAEIAGALALAPVDGERFIAAETDELRLYAYADATVPRAVLGLGAPALSLAAYPDRRVVVGGADLALHFYRATPDTLVAADVPVPGPLATPPRGLRAGPSGRFLVVSDRAASMEVLDLQNQGRAMLPPHLSGETFEVSAADQLLLSGIGILGYDLAAGSGQPLVDFGGHIQAIAISPRDDLFALAYGEQIYLRADSRHQAVPERRLRGNLELATLLP
jgi:hypothetical protein